ncbi:MAG TPA: hypothetical protein PLY87_10765 [Planctomycetaceae bacterium]|nr:hypothetical protein [Planctomycetaceae bacterium]
MALFGSIVKRKSDCRVYCLLALSLICAASVGCDGASDNSAIDARAKANENVADECRRKLNSAIGRLQPESMATQTRKEAIAGSLNSWMSACVPENDRKLAISDADSALLSPGVLRAANLGRFTESDTNYIRDCLLLSKLTESLWKQADADSGAQVGSDLDRVMQTFRHIMRNVSPLRASESRLPLGLYEVLLTGRGSIDDRLWILAEALRQRQIDSMILKTSTPGDPAATSLIDAVDTLLVIVIQDKALLFDPVRGTAVPKADDQSLVVTDPADISMIAENERWKSAVPYVVANPAAFAPRMFLLQQRMEAQDAATLYEELAGGTTEIRPLIQRLSSVVGSTWPADTFRVWDVPEQKIAAAAALDEKQKEEYSRLLRPLDSPFERESINVGDALDDPNVNFEELTEDERMQRRISALEERWARVGNSSDELFGKPSKRLLSTRVRQICGSADIGIIQDLQQIRQASMQTQIQVEMPVDGKRVAVIPVALPEMIRTVQQNALGDTLYWTSMLQLSRGDAGAALSTLRNYRIQYPDGPVAFASLMNEADSLMLHGNLDGAKAALRQADVDENPEQIRAHWLLSRLEAAK